MKRKTKLTIRLIVIIATVLVSVITVVHLYSNNSKHIYEGMVLDMSVRGIDWSENVYSFIQQNYKSTGKIHDITDSKYSSAISPYIRTFKSWSELVDFLGFAPWNPFEGEPWLVNDYYNRANGIGNSNRDHCFFDCSVPEPAKISLATLKTGYICNDVGITITSYLGNPLHSSYEIANTVKTTIQVATMADEEDSTYDCVVTRRFTTSNKSLSINIDRDGRCLCSVELNTQSGGDSIQKVFKSVCTLLGIDVDIDDFD